MNAGAKGAAVVTDNLFTGVAVHLTHPLVDINNLAGDAVINKDGLAYRIEDSGKTHLAGPEFVDMRCDCGSHGIEVGSKDGDFVMTGDKDLGAIITMRHSSGPVSQRPDMAGDQIAAGGKENQAEENFDCGDDSPLPDYPALCIHDSGEGKTKTNRADFIAGDGQGQLDIVGEVGQGLVNTVIFLEKRL